MIGIAPQGTVRQLLSLCYGPLIWFAHFILIYGAAGFGGAFGVAPQGVRFFAWAATVAAGAAIITLLARADLEIDPALHEIARALAALSLLAVLLEAMVLWVVPS